MPTMPPSGAKKQTELISPSKVNLSPALRQQVEKAYGGWTAGVSSRVAALYNEYKDNPKLVQVISKDALANGAGFEMTYEVQRELECICGQKIFHCRKAPNPSRPPPPRNAQGAGARSCASS